MSDLLQRLRERKLVQWAVAYLAGAWVLLQVSGLIGQQFDWSPVLLRGITVAAGVGFFVVLVLAWYHGERGAQRISGTELSILALLLAIGGGLLWHFAPEARPGATSASASAHAPAPVLATVPAKSIAVLPFVNMSGDAKNEYFSDGITEEILNALAQLPDLKVAARTSAFAFKGKGEDLRKVGETLGVAHVLEGSVQSAGDDVRITAQLIDARNGFHLWSERYDRKLTNLFAVEDEISKAIAEHLKLTLQGTEPLVGQKTIDARAHDLYLRGLALLPARGQGMLETKSYFEQAVAVDPNYAQAWAGLSFIHVLLSAYGMEPWQEAIDHATAAAERALALDPRSGESHAAAASVYRNKMEFERAGKEYEEAIALNPGDAETYDQYAQMLSAVGEIDHAIEVARKSVDLNPLAAHPHYTLGYVLMYGRRHAEAQAELRRALELSPAISTARIELALAYIGSRQFAEAEVQARIGARESGEDPELIAAVIRAIANPGLRSDAIRRLDQGGPVGNYDLFVVAPGLWYCLLGAHDKALDSLEREVAATQVGERYYSMQTLYAPAFDPIRNEPRFKALLAKYGVPDRAVAIKGR